MDEQLAAVAALASSVLGDGLTGMYLHGSAVLGGLQPGSDLDVLVVTGRATTAAQRRALIDGLLAGTGPRPVELAVVTTAAVRPWRYPPVGELLYGEWLRPEFEAGLVPEPEPMPDLALLIATVLAGDRPLLGPPPAALLDRPPAADVLRASVDGIPGLVADLPWDTRNVLLTLARIWTTAVTGEIRPKHEAAGWALARLPAEHRAVLAHARAIYLGEAEERWPDGIAVHVRPHVDWVLAEIRARSPR